MMGRQPLDGQKALVTGANSGIGERVARALAAAGADVGVIHGQTLFVDGGMTLYPEFARGG